MPRGIPNTKRDDTGMRYTTFHVPLTPNPKHVNSTYLKSDVQSLWARNASKKLREGRVEDAAPQEQQKRGSQVLVIHPGSRFLRLGKASDITPISIPCVVARKYKPPIPKMTRRRNVAHPRSLIEEDKARGISYAGVDEEMSSDGRDSFDAKIAALTMSLKERMRFYKLRATPNAATIASTFNRQFEPEILSEYNDPFRIQWIGETSTEEVLVGEKVLRIADPEKAGYVVRRPIYGRNFNYRDYPSVQLILSDLEALIRVALADKYGMTSKDYKHYSVVLVIPDLYDRAYVRDFINLIISMGFKQFCAQQESLAATYGAGISNACVVDIGATATTIACVDEGLIIPDTRLKLNVGGDDITEFLYVLLRRINLPYRGMDLVRSYDWNVMEDLKTQLCTLTEGDVALNLYAFTVRQPNKPTEKYGLRAYDEIILAPMCLFEPRVIAFESKRMPMRNTHLSSVTDEVIDHGMDMITNAMLISTKHLISSATENTANKSTARNSAGSTPEIDQATATNNASRSTSQAPTELQQDGDEKFNSKASQIQGAVGQVFPRHSPPPIYPGGYSIDVPFEASKLPLDVAIFNSVRAAGGDDRIRKYLQAVLVIGGTAHISGIGQALESRLQAIATPVIAGMEKVQVIPPPKEVNHQILIWKGAAVLGKMDSVSELWVTPADWDILGMRGLKERCFFL